MNKLTDKGAVLYADIKMSLGTSVGLATLLNGRCLISGKIHASKILLITVSRSAVFIWDEEKDLDDSGFLGSTVISIFSIILLAPY